MVDVEQQLDVWRSDLLHDLCNIIHVIALVAGMPFHGVRIVASVEHFDTDGNLVTFSVGGEFFEAGDAVLGTFFCGDLTTGRVIRVAPLVAIKSNHVGEPGLSIGIDRLTRAGNHFLVVSQVV